MESNYNNVIIIGNGFDQNLGLKTSYSDFVESDEFKGNLTYPLFKYLYDQKQIKRWIDLEIELKNYAEIKTNKTTSRDFHYGQFKELCTSLQSYLRKLDYNKIKQKSDAATFLRENATIDNTLIINFNYTDTVTRIIGHNTKEIKMHGSYNKDIIIGIEDDVFLSKEFIFLKKSTSPIYPNIDCNKILSNAKNIYFFGYSLGETDHSYFKSFFSQICMEHINNNGKHITFFYYTENGRLDILHELDNLTHREIGSLKQRNNIVFTEVY